MSVIFLVTCLCIFVTRASQTCNPVQQTCNIVGNKIPVVTKELPTHGVEAPLAPTEKEQFEQLLGRGLLASEAVAWISHKFAKQMLQFLVKGHDMLHENSAPSKALAEVFASPKCDWTISGHPGANIDDVLNVFHVGNRREFWGLMYCLTKTLGFSALMSALLKLVQPSWFESELDMNATAIAGRWELVQATQQMPEDQTYGQGVPDFEFPQFESWVRFDYDAKDKEGNLLWERARVGKPLGCSDGENSWSDDPLMQPPLSATELRYQCGNETRCKVRWYSGKSCYSLPVVPFGSLPGYRERAEALGYHIVAGPSGTTYNMLQIGLLLGFNELELMLLRATMAAWMIPAKDHSFFEIMLGAEPFLSDKFRLEMGPGDLHKLWPFDVHLPDGPTFSAKDFWCAAASKFDSIEDIALIEKIDYALPGARIGQLLQPCKRQQTLSGSWPFLLANQYLLPFFAFGICLFATRRGWLRLSKAMRNWKPE